MAYPPNQVPDAPKPLSMMPRVEVFHSDDLLYIAQLQNNPGERSRAATLLEVLQAIGTILPAKSIPGDRIVDHTITADKLAALSVATETLQALCVTEEKLAGASVSTGKIKDGAVTLAKLDSLLKRAKVEATPETSAVPTSDQTYATMATITTPCISRLVDVSVRFQVSAVTPELSDTNDHDFEIELAVSTPGVTNFKVASKRINWKYYESHEVRLVYEDTHLTQQSSLIVRVKKTASEGTSGTPGYWPGSPSTFVLRHIDVTGILP